MKTRARILLAAPWALCTAAAIATSGPALYAQSGGATTRWSKAAAAYGRLQQAVDAIGGGKGSIAISSGLHADCAVQTAGDITYLASEPGKAVFDGVTCEGKAALVLRGRSGEHFGAGVPEHAGARFQRRRHPA